MQLRLYTADQNGEKRLRSLIGATPEWRSTEARLALAARCDASDEPVLAMLLRSRNLAKLRKGFALELCRAWSYKCDVWSRKSGPVVKRPASPPLSAQQALVRSQRAAPRLEVRPWWDYCTIYAHIAPPVPPPVHDSR